MSQQPSEGAVQPDGRRLRWAQHRTTRRAAFVQAGVAAVDEYGPNASAEQIADLAGVSRTVLYRYFRDREDLRQAIAEAVQQAVVGEIVPHLNLTAESTPHEIIHSTIDVVVGWLDDHPNLYYFLRARRTGASLTSVEATVADQVAELLKLVIMFFGVDPSAAAPGAYGIAGFVEASGAWWLATRSLSRAAFTDFLCQSVWNVIDGAARDAGIRIGYDDPLPAAVATEEVS